MASWSRRPTDIKRCGRATRPGRSGFSSTRPEVHEKFRLARRLLGKYRLFASPLYLEFLCGERELHCAAWANPTRNVRGWRTPCYLIADGHCRSYRELIASTDWSARGAGQRSALRALPDALRFRAGRGAGRQPALARRAENGRLANGVNMAAMLPDPCHFGVVFALGIEAGGTEDLLHGAVTLRGQGFVVRQGELRDRRIVLVQSGPGRTRAASAAQALLDGHHPEVVISAGFAGGLDPEAPPRRHRRGRSRAGRVRRAMRR